MLSSHRSFRTNFIAAGVLLLCLAVTACGFQPMYGANSSFGDDSPLYGNILIENVPGRDGQILKSTLEDLLNPEGIKSADPKYRLQIQITKNLLPAVVKSDGTVQRYDVKFITNFTLIDSITKASLLSGEMQRIGSYNVATNANFATYEAGQDVAERTLKELAEDYVLRLSGYFSSPHDK